MQDMGYPCDRTHSHAQCVFALFRMQSQWRTLFFAYSYEKTSVFEETVLATGMDDVIRLFDERRSSFMNTALV